MTSLSTTARETHVLQITGLTKRFGANEVLRGIDLDVVRGERVAILGASGSGKSTLLRCLNFIELPSDGTVEFEGRIVGEPGRRGGNRVYSEPELTKVRQKIGMVFQQFNLFPHMTALQNVMLGLVKV